MIANICPRHLSEALRKDATAIRGNIHRKKATAPIRNQEPAKAAATRAVMKRVCRCPRDNLAI